MKYILSTLFLVLFIAFGALAQNGAVSADPSAPKMKFETETIDYGTIPQYGDSIRYFKFTNSGKSNLVITSCTGSCGCTVPSCPQEVIKPGASGKIQVKYDTKRVGNFSKMVTVSSNADRPSIVLQIKGTVLEKK